MDEIEIDDDGIDIEVEDDEWIEVDDSKSWKLPDVPTNALYIIGAVVLLYVIYILWARHKEKKKPKAVNRQKIAESWANRMQATDSTRSPAQPNLRQRQIPRTDKTSEIAKSSNQRNIYTNNANDANNANDNIENISDTSNSVSESEDANIEFQSIETDKPSKPPETVLAETKSFMTKTTEPVKMKSSTNEYDVQQTDKPVNKNTSKGAEKAYASKQKNEHQRSVVSKKPAGKDEVLLNVLTEILGINVMKKQRTSGYNPGILEIPESDLNAIATDIKCSIIFEKRLAKEYMDKTKICSMIYNNCTQFESRGIPDVIEGERKEIEDTVSQVLQHMKRKSSQCIVATLYDAIYDMGGEEDDLWSAVTSSQDKSNVKSESVLFLERVSGWPEDNIAIRDDLFTQILEHSQSNPKFRRVMCLIVQFAAKDIAQTKRLDELMFQKGRLLSGLELFIRKPKMVEFLIEAMEEDLKVTATSMGSYFESESPLGPLFGLSTLTKSLAEVAMQIKSEANLPWTTMPNFPKPSVNDLQSVERRILEGVHKMQQAVFQMLKQAMKSNKEVSLKWLASLVNTNEMRVNVTPQIHPLNKNTVSPSVSDGFMLNLCSTLLDLCLPFCGNDDRIKKLDPTYSTAHGCKLNYDFETCLAGGQIVSDESSKSGEGDTPQTSEVEYNFMTEIFNITLRAMNVGHFPVWAHFKKLQRIMSQNIQMAKEKDENAAKDLQAKNVVLVLRWDCMMVDPEYIQKGIQFYLTVARWLHLQLQMCEQVHTSPAKAETEQRKLFSRIPEYIVKDMASWFHFLTTTAVRVHPEVTRGIDVTPFVDFCVKLLGRPDLLPGPIPAYRITQALLGFVESGKEPDRMPGLGGTSNWFSGLSSHVHLCPAVQSDLGPALVVTYVSVDVVEGLDVDKEDFDKYGARAEIGKLLKNLWERHDCRSSIIALCGSEQFQGFLGAILDTLLYQLHDSLGRLANVKKIQLAKEDEASWNRLTPAEKQDKLKFLANEEHVSKGFMRMATDTLDLIDLLTKEEKVAKCLTVPPLVSRAGSAFIGFLDTLCGPKASQFKVKDMQKYNFQPRVLLGDILDILLRIVYQDADLKTGFVQCFSSDPDFSDQCMQKAIEVMTSKGVGRGEMVGQFEKFYKQVTSIIQEMQASTQNKETSDWQTVITNVTIDEEKLLKEYEMKMGSLMFDATDLQDYHSLESMAARQSVDPRSPKAKALMKELRQWNTSLPMHPHAACFIRQDEERMDMVRALVTGPINTPYSFGCFCFDIYFPSNYPNVPPVVQIITTGNKTVRFNPNLYADGKVCLSLLGTWHAGDSSQKWQANKSTLYQVLVSIQSMILISDPVYNEPGYEGIQDTEEGKAKSAEYNASLRLHTVRHAMLGQLRNPAQGFKTVIQRHFKLLKTSVLKQCCDWLNECTDRDLQKKLQREVDALKCELDKLDDIADEDENEEDTESEDEEEDIYN